MPNCINTNQQLQLLTQSQDERQILGLEIGSTLLLKERLKIKVPRPPLISYESNFIFEEKTNTSHEV